AVAVMVGGVGDNAVRHGVDVGASGGCKGGAAVAAVAKVAGNVLVAVERVDRVQGPVDLDAGAVLLDLGLQIGVIGVFRLGGSRLDFFLFLSQGLGQRLRLGDGGILLLDTALEFSVLAVQLIAQVGQSGKVGFQVRLVIFQLLLLVVQVVILG